MPLIQLAKAVAGLEADETIEIVGDDPIFEIGVREFCEARGFDIEQADVNGREVRLELRAKATKKAGTP